MIRAACAIPDVSGFQRRTAKRHLACVSRYRKLPSPENRAIGEALYASLMPPIPPLAT